MPATPDPDVLTDAAGVLPEGLLVAGGVAWWVDIERDEMWRHDGGAPQRIPLATRASTVLAIAGDGGALVADAAGLATVHPDGRTERHAALAGEPPGTRSNDAVLLDDGSVLLGTMDLADPSARPGRLHRFAPGATTSVQVGPPVAIPNTFVPLDDGRVLVTDSDTAVVMAVDPRGGGYERHPLTDAVPAGATPDGGCRWGELVLIALWDGWGVWVVDLAAGRSVGVLALPVPRPTNCAVDEAGGRLVVTTASVGLDAAAREAAPLSGHVLGVPLDAVPTA